MLVGLSLLMPAWSAPSCHCLHSYCQTFHSLVVRQFCVVKLVLVRALWHLRPSVGMYISSGSCVNLDRLPRHAHISTTLMANKFLTSPSKLAGLIV